MGSSFLFNKPILDQEISVGRGLNRYTDVIAAPEMTKFCVFCRKIIINRVHNGEFTSEWWLLPYVLKLMYNIISPLAATIPTYLSLSSSPDPKGPTIWSLILKKNINFMLQSGPNSTTLLTTEVVQCTNVLSTNLLLSLLSVHHSYKSHAQLPLWVYTPSLSSTN